MVALGLELLIEGVGEGVGGLLLEFKLGGEGALGVERGEGRGEGLLGGLEVRVPAGEGVALLGLLLAARKHLRGKGVGRSLVLLGRVDKTGVVGQRVRELLLRLLGCAARALPRDVSARPPLRPQGRTVRISLFGRGRLYFGSVPERVVSLRLALLLARRPGLLTRSRTLGT